MNTASAWSFFVLVIFDQRSEMKVWTGKTVQGHHLLCEAGVLK